MQLTKYRAFGKSRFIQMAVSLLSMLIYSDACCADFVLSGKERIIYVSLCPGRKPKEGNSFNDFSVFVDKCVVVLHYLYHLSEYRVLHYGKPHGIYTEKYI